MKQRIISLVLCLSMLFMLLPAVSISIFAADNALPTELVLAPSEANGLPVRITSVKTTNDTLYLPGNADVSQCFFSWEGGLPATVNGVSYESGALPIPRPGQTETYTFRLNGKTASFTIKTFQGASDVAPIFIEIDESFGTIAAMNGDPNHDTTCTGVIYIDGALHQLPKMKGRGNYAWSQSKDKRAYNITLGAKTNLLGIDSEKTKKWSLLANVCDHSLLRDKIGYDLGYQMGVGLDSANADVWMNGVYQGTYLVTPKTDSFTSKDGYLLENDNNTEPAISAGGDPSFTLRGLYGSGGSDVNNNYDNRITVKDIGDNVLRNADGVVDESEANLNAVTGEIHAHLQDAWDAIRADDGYNDKGVYYADYIDLTSFAKMYLVLEYCKDYDVCAGSNFFQRYATGENDKYYAGPVWDLDTSLGATQQNWAFNLPGDIDMTTGYGWFIRNINDYRTSIYKNLGKHPDFMEEVLEVYLNYKDVFDAIPGKVSSIAQEIEASAMMNFQKVDPVDNYNVARYSSRTVKNAGTPYEQVYLATTDSKTDWPNYIANLKTFCEARTKFFAENMVETYSDPVIGEVGDDLAPEAQVYSDYTASWENLNGINNPSFEPTSSNQGIGLGWGNWSQTTGSEHYVGFRWTDAVTVGAIDVYWYDDNGGTRVPSDFHLEYADETGDFHRITFDSSVDAAKQLNRYNRLTFPATTTTDLRLVMTTASNASGIYRLKVYNTAELEGIPVVFHTTTRASVKTFDTQDPTQGGTENADFAFARNAAGEIDNDGNGQVTFRIVTAEGYVVRQIRAEPEDSFDSITALTDSGAENAYRITGVTGRVDVTVVVEKGGTEPDPEPEDCPHEFGEDGICTVCGEEAIRVDFVCGDGATVTVFKTRDLSAGGDMTDHAYPRSGVDSSIDVSGEGQVNFVISVDEDYEIDMVTAEPAENYKNLKGSEDTLTENAYRITKVKGDITVTVKTRESVPAPCEHDYQAVATAPTCTEGGYTTYTCARCGDSYVSDEVDALGHDWDEGAVTTAPTEAAPGVRTFTCTRCSETRTEAIPALEHVHDYQPVVTAPTCTEGGYTTYTCARCGDSYVSDEVDALGHGFVDGICTRCGEKAPEDDEPFRFDDVLDSGKFYYDPVYWAYDTEPQITNGLSASLFGPYNACTRGHVVTFLWRAAGCPEPERAGMPFTDLAPGAFYEKAVAWAVEQEITNGTSETTFSPDAACTRGQIVTFLWRFKGKEEPAGTETPFTDLKPGAFYEKAVAWAIGNEITNGMTVSTFVPNGICTRGQIVTFLYRAIHPTPAER